LDIFMEHITADVQAPCTIDDAKRGLARREFFFVYQPKLRLQEGRLSGFESLLRWRHPSRGVLTPNSFIGLVEDSPLTASFTDFVVAEAAQTLADWTVRGYDTLSLAVNLPAREIGRPGWANKLSTLLDLRSINASLLQIELTEATDPGSIEVLASAIESLKETGVSVAIDDFGAGCWSLSVLHRLGVDTLKLDRSFMCDIQENTNSKVVIEGIETEAQFAWASRIEQIDCQGYYISAPIAKEQVDKLVARYGLTH
jgi:EAL domain-containing protein (putative c-di-GMP-specific phosphodiesterase class I)